MINNPFSLLSWRDGIEILFISGIFYKISLWLKRDHQKSLLPILYGYSLLLIISFATQLQTLSTLLLAFSPALFMLFILVHQKTLQKNFIAFKTITPAQITSDDWVEALIRTSLMSLSKKKQLMYIIERGHTLAEFIEPGCTIDAPLHKPLLDLIIESTSFDQTKFLWINGNGHLLGVNADWKTIDQDWMSSEIGELAPWHRTALLMTTKTDALVVCANPEAKAFTLIIGGTTVDQLNAAQLFTLIKKYLRVPTTSHKQGEMSNAPQSQKYSAEQQQS